MQTIKHTKKLLVAAILVGLLVPQLSRCAALPERSDISPEKQKKLDKQLLHGICRSPDLSHMQKALDDGADPNSVLHPIFMEFTPLGTAIHYNNPAMVKALIDAGANFENFLLYRNISPAIAAPLIEAGANLNGTIDTTCTPKQDQHRYLQIPLLKIIRFREALCYSGIDELIDAGADLNIQDENGCTALIYIVCMRTYLYTSAHSSHRSTDYQLHRSLSALEIADNIFTSMVKSANRLYTPEVARKLILAGADETVLDNSGHDALYYAARNESYPEMPSIILAALEERDQIKKTREDNIRCGTEPMDETLKGACAYLLTAPLPIDSLSYIFSQYATETNPVMLAKHKAQQATIIQRKRAEETRKKAAEWQAAQRARRQQQATATTCCVIS